MNELGFVRHNLEPVFDSRSRFLVLGTMPSPVSRERGFYYAHPQNRFWEVLSRIFDDPLPRTVEEKRKLVLSHGIALWDVLASCEISGADDSSIRKPEANDLFIVLSAAPIARIFTTGGTAFALYNRLCRGVTGREAVRLPSTSSANRGRYPLDRLVEAYAILKSTGSACSSAQG